MKTSIYLSLRKHSDWFIPFFSWGISLIILILVMHFYEDKPIFEAFYYGIVTASTTGYGDVLPTTTIGKVCTIFYMIVAISAMGMFLGAIFSKFKLLNKKKRYGMSKITSIPKLVIIGYPSNNKVMHIVAVLRTYWKDCLIVCITDKLDEKLPWMYEYNVDFVKGRGSQKSVLCLANVEKAEKILILAEDPSNVASDEHTAAAIMVCEIFNSNAYTIAEKVGNSRDLFEMAKCNKIVDVSRPNELANEVMHSGSIDFVDTLFSSKTEEHQKNIKISENIAWDVLQNSLIKDGEIAIGYSENNGSTFTFVPKKDTIIPKGALVKILTRSI